MAGQAEAGASAGQERAAYGRCGEVAQLECTNWGGKPEDVIRYCLRVSFEAYDEPGAFLRHHEYKLYVNAKLDDSEWWFESDATFRLVEPVL